MKTIIKWGAIAAFAVIAPLSAEAHRAWILPAGTVFSAENPWVTVDLAISNDIFFFEHRPMPVERVRVTAPDGSEVKPENVSTGRLRSVMDLQLTRQGTYRIASVMGGVFARWMENGEPKRWRGPVEALSREVPAGARDLVVTHAVNRVETYVTAGKPTIDNLRPTGEGLELEPITHPNDLYAEETATFRLLIDGAPAANVEVEVIRDGIRYRDSLDEIKIRTDADGRFSVTWPEAGRYWLSAEYQDDKPRLPQAHERRASYVVTLEVLPQ